MIKYVILIWNKDDLSDIRILKNPFNDESRVFNEHALAEIHAKTRTRNVSYRVVEIPIIED